MCIHLKSKINYEYPFSEKTFQPLKIIKAAFHVL